MIRLIDMLILNNNDVGMQSTTLLIVRCSEKAEMTL